MAFLFYATWDHHSCDQWQTFVVWPKIVYLPLIESTKGFSLLHGQLHLPVHRCLSFVCLGVLFKLSVWAKMVSARCMQKICANVFVWTFTPQHAPLILSLFSSPVTYPVGFGVHQNLKSHFWGSHPNGPPRVARKVLFTDFLASHRIHLSCTQLCCSCCKDFDFVSRFSEIFTQVLSAHR